MKIRVSAAGRTVPRDIAPIIDISQRTGLRLEVCAFIGSSPIRQYVEQWDVDLIAKRSAEAIDVAVKAGLPVAYVTEDTTRSRPDVLTTLFRAAVDHGASRLCLSDTVGHATPDGVLNPLAINCLRNFPVYGPVCWGARTLFGADQLADDYKYIPVRRFALFLEESLYRGTQWVVFEPNDEPLWSAIRLNVGSFMQSLFRQGAFQGTTPTAAYFVKCDDETTTQNDINNGIVNIIVGFAPLKPAEFVVIQIQQIAGQVTT